jgi:hypothetical protein
LRQIKNVRLALRSEPVMIGVSKGGGVQFIKQRKARFGAEHHRLAVDRC